MNAKDVIIILLLVDNIATKKKLCKKESQLIDCKNKQKKNICTYKKYHR